MERATFVILNWLIDAVYLIAVIFIACEYNYLILLFSVLVFSSSTEKVFKRAFPNKGGEN